MNTNIELDWFWLKNLKPVRIYNYPSSVEYKIFEADLNDQREMDQVNGLVLKTFVEVYELLEQARLTDNKIVLECQLKLGVDTIFLGWKDGKISIGYGCHAYDNQEPWELSVQEDGSIFVLRNEQRRNKDVGTIAD